MREPVQASERFHDVESWWNSLKPAQRVDMFRFIPLRSREQVAVFSCRGWHELQGWMRDDIRKLFNTPGLVENLDVVAYFRAQKRLGRGQSIHGVTYFAISDADRELLPELGQSYAIALEELPTTSGKAHYWLIQTEAAYDDDILVALSSVGLSTAKETPHQ